MSAHHNKKRPPANHPNVTVASDTAARIATLTPAERQVFAWVCEGKQSPEIAIILGREKRTVENQLASIFRKLGVNNRVLVARIGIECGLTLAAPDTDSPHSRRRKQP